MKIFLVIVGILFVLPLPSIAQSNNKLEYFATVNQDKAIFTFPIQYKQKWYWGQCGGKEYGWEVLTNNFKFGFSKFNPMSAGDYSGNGSLKELIEKNGQCDIWKNNYVVSDWYNKGKLSCSCNESQNEITIELLDKNVIKKIFYNKPKYCKFEITSCVGTKNINVLISYSSIANNDPRQQIIGNWSTQLSNQDGSTYGIDLTISKLGDIYHIESNVPMGGGLMNNWDAKYTNGQFIELSNESTKTIIKIIDNQIQLLNFYTDKTPLLKKIK